MSELALGSPELRARLRRAREERGLTQEDVARDLQLARTTVVAIEAGDRRLRPQELVRMAELYGERLDELLRPGAPPRRLTAHLRAAFGGMPEEPELARAVAQVQRLAEDFAELEKLMGAGMGARYPPRYDLPGKDPERQAEWLARAERERLQLGDGPLPHLRDVLEHDVGLRIFSLPLPARVAGLFGSDDHLGACVAINAHQRWERQRFSLAHEYAHFLIDRDRPDVSVALASYRRVPAVERFAEAFARFLLLPQSGVERRFEAAKEAAGRLTNALLLQQADYWQVSLQAMVLRLEDLRLIKSGHWARLEREGFRPDEGRRLLGLPLTAPDAVLLPRRFQVLALTAYREGRISEGRLAAFMRQDRVTARQTLSVLGLERDEEPFA
jgi:Zn-dependent peptidase ImmA (M78 family)/transcriptional regulator with XRE-family HTH domain